MRKLMAVVGVLSVVVALAQAAFTQPTADQIKEAAKDPAKLTAILQGASEAEVATVLTGVMDAVADLKLGEKELTERVNVLMAKAMEGRSDVSKASITQLLIGNLEGKSKVAPILAIIRPPLPPRLGAGGPPPLAPRYGGQ